MTASRIVSKELYNYEVSRVRDLKACDLWMENNKNCKCPGCLTEDSVKVKINLESLFQYGNGEFNQGVKELFVDTFSDNFIGQLERQFNFYKESRDK